MGWPLLSSPPDGLTTHLSAMWYKLPPLLFLLQMPLLKALKQVTIFVIFLVVKLTSCMIIGYWNFNTLCAFFSINISLGYKLKISEYNIWDMFWKTRVRDYCPLKAYALGADEQVILSKCVGTIYRVFQCLLRIEITLS